MKEENSLGFKMRIIEINKRIYTIPSEWNEMSGIQLIRCMHVFTQKWTDEKKMLKFLQILTGMSKWRLVWASVDEMSEYFYLLDFLFQENLTRNILPEYKGYYGPADGLQNLIVSEFVFTESHFQQYKENENQADLDNLIAVLYRPGKLFYNHKKNPDGDVRVRFNDNLIGHYGSKINSWPLPVKLGILHFYEGCRAKIIEDYKDVFGSDGEPAKRGILSVVVSMAESGVFGDFEKVEKLYLQTFMIGMSESIDKAKKLEQASKQPAS